MKDIFIFSLAFWFLGCAGSGGSSGSPPGQGELKTNCDPQLSRISFGECLMNRHSDILTLALDRITQAQQDLEKAQDPLDSDLEFPLDIKSEANLGYSSYRIAVQSALSDAALFNNEVPFNQCADDVSNYINRLNSGSAAYTHFQMISATTKFLSLNVSIVAQLDEAYAELGVGAVSMGLHYSDQLVPVLTTCFITGPNSAP